MSSRFSQGYSKLKWSGKASLVPQVFGAEMTGTGRTGTLDEMLIKALGSGFETWDITLAFDASKKKDRKMIKMVKMIEMARTGPKRWPRMEANRSYRIVPYT